MIIIRWKQSTCLLTDEWINKMEYYSTLKRREALTPVRICTSLEDILQARILEWVAFFSSRGSSQPRDQSQVSRIAGGFSTS